MASLSVSRHHHARLAPWTMLPFLALAVMTGPALAVDIGDLHCNTSSGVPASPYTIGTVVAISGIVTAGTGTFTSTYTDVFIQDETGGMQIYDPGIPTTFAPGDSVTISGPIDQFRGNTEVLINSWIKHSMGHPDPEPVVVTCYELAHSFGPDYCEPNESRLVRINDVTYSGTWPSFSGALTLTDATGSCIMYIDGDTGVQNVTPPGGTFSVVGIIKQYAGYAPPYTSDYQIMPRRPEDIINQPGPQIIEGPYESDIQGDRVTIYWVTDQPATSSVEYGFSNQYEEGQISDPTLVTEHSVDLTGLYPANIYHYRVQTENEFGQTQSGNKLFCSGSGPESTGEIVVYFNKSVNTSLALGEEAQGNVNVVTKLVELIDGAQYSIDASIYSFDIPVLGDALIAAHNRGVDVRFITENRDTYQSQVQRLISAGIPVIDDSFGPNSGGGLMHNKFFIFDARGGSPNGSDDWVWTGSTNLNNSGAFTDQQNVIAVQDQALAAVYTVEFNEMWGSATNTPNSANSRFGSNKLDNTPKRFNVNGVPMKLYFSPSDNVMQAAIQEVLDAEMSLHFAILAYTRTNLSIEMRERWYNVPGFELRGVFDSAEGSTQYSQYHNMMGSGDFPWDPPADVWLDLEAGSLHHKYMILDVNRAGLEPTVITGSANWSNNGNDNNDENMLIVHDFRTANLYFQEFAARYAAAGGGGDLTVDAPEETRIPQDWSLMVAPNPVTDRISVRYALPEATGGRITLYGPDGRREAVLYQGEFPAGPGTLEFRATGDGLRISNGIHFLRMETGLGEMTTRVLILR